MTFATRDERLESDGPFHVAVIGAGASGALVAAQFQKLAPQGRLALVSDAPRPARGVAYETPYRAHVLNVPAGKMSAFPQEMDHFLSWLKQRLPDAHAGTFAPRRLYGEYLAGVLEEATSESPTIEPINDTAIGLTVSQNNTWRVHLKSGRSIESMCVVLAFGNLQAPGDPIDFDPVASRYWRNPWACDAVTGLDPDAPVLLIGTGLTMADVALSLREVGHRGPIHALSRHGRISNGHQPHQPWPLPVLPLDFASPSRALRWIRNEIKAAEQGGSDWRGVIDSLRPRTQKIWQAWSTAQRKTFLRHARSLWDIHRHRLAPDVASRLASLLESGVLKVHRGRLTAARREGGEALVTWKNANGELSSLTVARIINCTGPSRDYSYSRSPLITQLRAAGLLVPDELRLGFETDPEGRFVDADGEPVQGLFTLGPIRMPALWESIAIPEIRDQALVLAKRIVLEAEEREAATLVSRSEGVNPLSARIRWECGPSGA